MRFLIPEKGVSALDIEGGAFFDPRGRRGAVRGARSAIGAADRHRRSVTRLPLHINDPEFADAAVAAFAEIATLERLYHARYRHAPQSWRNSTA